MNYHKIEKTSIANGPGVRVVLWVSGCSLHCRECHNPETWDINSGKLFDEDAKKELFDALDKPYIQGITFSGGHPLETENVENILKLCEEVRKKYPEKDIWLYTGYNFDCLLPLCFEITESMFIPNYDSSLLGQIAAIINRCDVIVDGPYVSELKDITLRFRGSSNQRVIDVKKTISSGEIVLWQEED